MTVKSDRVRLVHLQVRRLVLVNIGPVPQPHLQASAPKQSVKRVVVAVQVERVVANLRPAAKLSSGTDLLVT